MNALTDIVEVVRQRLASGLSIADHDIQALITEIDMLREVAAVLKASGLKAG